MPSIYELIPDHELLLDLEPEELAGIVLEYLKSLPEGSAELNRNNFGLPHTVADYPREHQTSISRALMEGWMWLEKEGFVAPEPGQTGEWFFITRRGLRVRNARALEAYRLANLLPRQLLHPTIATDAWASFSRGKYDEAVFPGVQRGGSRCQGCRGLSGYRLRCPLDATSIPRSARPSDRCESTTGGKGGNTPTVRRRDWTLQKPT